MSLTPLFESDDRYLTMFDKLQLQYNKQGYSGSFCLFDVWGDIETDLDINKVSVYFYLGYASRWICCILN